MIFLPQEGWFFKYYLIIGVEEARRLFWATMRVAPMP